jgi:hypothetical protein
MSARIVGTFHLVEALAAEGFPLPDDVREARLVMGVAEAFLIQYDVFVTEENLAKLGRALQRLAAWDDHQTERR